ncbi:MAG: hypothetical protein JST80_11410 [Bdellovibrionales bacterium]|nr:hypothetical protein [Bdellovibrionales bacterium]
MKTMNILAAVALCFSVVGCYKASDLDKAALLGNAGTNANIPLNSAISMQVTSGGTTLYDSGSSATAGFKAQVGKTYAIKVHVSNLKNGDKAELQMQNTSVPSAPVQKYPMDGNGDYNNSNVTFGSPGDYMLKTAIVKSDGSQQSAAVISSVQCANPTFTASSLNSSGISVSGSNNVYTYNGASVVSGANGQAPYQCAWDFTGVGIVDSAFADCANPVTNYSSYVSLRNIGLVVKDACNTSFAVSKANVNLADTVPSSPGNVFIVGQVSAETGTASDIRIKGVKYHSENVGKGQQDVQPNYDAGTFTIQAMHDYDGAGTVHVPFGVKLVISGLTGTFDLRNNLTGTLSAATAKVKSITYITDQSGDDKPSVTLSGNTCTTTGLNVQILNPTGQPCSGGETGSNNMATVEVWGDYTCTNVNNGSGSATISGKFDGFIKLVDSCTGGGQGGGGVPPIKL